MYGAQTYDGYFKSINEFENDVEMYGAQTCQYTKLKHYRFENDVEMYGAQTTSCVSSFVP